MTLATLIQDLRTKTQGQHLSREEREALVEGKVGLPDGLEDTEIKFNDMNFGSKGPTPLYHLGFSAFPEMTLDEVQPVLNGVFARAMDYRVDEEVADVEYSVLWTPESFQAERDLPNFFTGRTMVLGSVFTVNPTKLRIGFSGQRNEISVSTEANRMTLQVEGKYRDQLRYLADTFKFQVAELGLSKDDSSTLLSKVRSLPLGEYLAKPFEKALQPEEMTGLSFSLGGGMQFSTNEVIRINVPLKLLGLIERTFGKPLVVSAEDTRVISLTKYYNALDLLRGKRLSDLQQFARTIPQIDLGFEYGRPVITAEEAGELLDKEIEVINDMYEPMSMFKYGINIHMARGGIVKRLARDHFGDEPVNRFDELGVNEYVDFLKSQDYSPEESFENEPDYIAKERHLLEFFNQSFAEGPKSSIENYRKSYVNNEPKLDILARSRGSDAAAMSKIKLPSRSRLFSFGITEHMHKATPYSNDLSISRTSPSSDTIHFWSRTSLDSPILLPLQEYACSMMGLTFK